VVDKSVLSSKAKILRLADQGLDASTENAAFLVSYIRACLINNPDLLEKREYASQLGWVGNGMAKCLPYDSNVRFDDGEENSYLLNAFQSKGCLGAWVSGMNKLRSNTQLRIMMAASFASPALEMLGGEVFVVSIFGSPGVEMTLALKCAASIWGGSGLVHTLDASEGALRQAAMRLRHFPLFADEFQPVVIKSSGNRDKAILSLCEGKDTKLNKKWLNTIILTSESEIAGSGSSCAALSRTVRIKVNDTLFKDRDEAARLIEENSGLAGSKFIEALKSHETQAQLRELVVENKKRLEAEFGDNSKLTMIAAILIAIDQIAEDIIFKSGRSLSISDFKACLATGGHSIASKHASQWVIGLIASNKRNFIDSNIAPSSENWGSFGKNGVVWFNRSILRDLMHKGGFALNNSLLRDWHAMGFMEKGNDGKYRHNRIIRGVKATYMKLLAPGLEDAENEK
jgi:hypothetical protein